MLVFTDNIRALVIQSLIAGGFLCLCYDVLRALRRFFNIDTDGEKMRGRRFFVIKLVALGVTDFLFCVFASACALILSYCANGGVFRGLQVACMAAGFFFVRHTISRPFTYILGILLRGIRRVIRMIIFIAVKITAPIFYLYHLTLGKIICIIKDRIKKNRESFGDSEGKRDVIIREDEKDQESSASQGRIFIGRRDQKL